MLLLAFWLAIFGLPASHIVKATIFKMISDGQHVMKLVEEFDDLKAVGGEPLLAAKISPQITVD